MGKDTKEEIFKKYEVPWFGRDVFGEGKLLKESEINIWRKILKVLTNP